MSQAPCLILGMWVAGTWLLPSSCLQQLIIFWSVSRRLPWFLYTNPWKAQAKDSPGKGSSHKIAVVNWVILPPSSWNQLVYLGESVMIVGMLTWCELLISLHRRSTGVVTGSSCQFPDTLPHHFVWNSTLITCGPRVSKGATVQARKAKRENTHPICVTMAGLKPILGRFQCDCFGLTHVSLPHAPCK